MNRRTAATLFFLAMVVTVACAVPRAGAEPAPVPMDELIRDSDLIVEAEVLSVTHPSPYGPTGGPGFLARLRVLKVIKGRPPSNPMPYWFVLPEPDVIGGRNESVFAGERVRLYLYRESSGRYAAWASNSIDVLENFPDQRRIFPDNPGETIYADGSRSTWTPQRRRFRRTRCGR